MDLGAVAHLATIEGRVPFINFFDGFRTSHEIQKIEVWDYEDLARNGRHGCCRRIPRTRALNPEHPAAARLRTKTATSSSSTARPATRTTMRFPASLRSTWARSTRSSAPTTSCSTTTALPDADRVIIAMGSICDVAEEVIDYLNAHGEKVGLVKVRLYRPVLRDEARCSYPRDREEDRSPRPHQGARRSRASRSTSTSSRARGRRRHRATRSSSAAATVSAPRIPRPLPSSPYTRS